MSSSIKSDVVTCPLCGGQGEMKKHLAVVRARSPQFRETLNDYEEDAMTPVEDPFETHQTVNTAKDSILNRRSWKE